MAPPKPGNDALQRFARLLRAEARVASERAAEAAAAGPGVQDIAERNTLAEERLLRLAESLETTTSDERAWVEQASEADMRAFAKAMRFIDPNAL